VFRVYGLTGPSVQYCLQCEKIVTIERMQVTRTIRRDFRAEKRSDYEIACSGSRSQSRKNRLSLAFSPTL